MSENIYPYLSEIENFSGSVLVAKDNKIIFKGGFGYSDGSSRIKNSEHTNFGIGSITKSFTALAIMQLVEKQWIRLEDGITNYFPTVYPNERITIHHLLSQTSGIPNYIYDKRVQTGESFSPERIISYVLEKKLKCKPGKKWLYSNTNYLLLAMVIEKVSGESYQAYIRKNIFEAIEMKNTYFDGENSHLTAVPSTSVFNCHPSLLLGAGDIVSNVEDLYLYDQALLTESLATRQSIEQMQEKAYDGFIIQYGYGWFIKNSFGQKSVCHGGFHPIGFTSHIERFVDDKLSIIVLSNELRKYSRFGVKYFNSTDLAREIAAKVYGKRVYPWQKFN